MLRLQGGTLYLVLKRDEGGERHVVGFHRRFEEALSSWTGSARVSPVFAVDGAQPPKLSGKKKSWLLFIGPTSPGHLAPTGGATFLTLGLFNVLVASSNKAEREAALHQANALKVPWEEWELQGHTLVNVTCSKPPKVKSRQQAIPDGGAVHAAAREYAILMASTQGRAAKSAPQLLRDIEEFDGAFQLLLKKKPFHVLAKQGVLVVTNAALSRHSSQTFAGTSPILETECHFWTHSLLGIGLASLALHRFRSFVSTVLAEAEIPDRLRALATVEHKSKHHLETLSSSDPFWDEEHVFGGKLPTVGKSDGVLPLLTCFSGRDGFRSTHVSLSVPLEVIDSCNATSWTLLTLTHEISHTVIEGVLGILYPDLADPKQVESMHALVSQKREPKTLLEAVQGLLCYALSMLDAEAVADSVQFGNKLRDEWEEANELLTHVFDFLYFYQSDASAYVRSVWASWGVVPNIQHRIPDYLTRSLCALHASNLRRNKGVDVTFDALTNALKATAKEFPELPFVSAGLNELSERADFYKGRLRRRIKLVRIVRSFLYSEDVSRKLAADPTAGGSNEKGGYDFRVSEFAGECIRNPLRFISAFSEDKASDSIKSLWVLAHVAFGEGP